jgi:hypothetical protein
MFHVIFAENRIRTALISAKLPPNDDSNIEIWIFGFYTKKTDSYNGNVGIIYILINLLKIHYTLDQI